LLERLVKIADHYPGDPFEFIFVDDGSGDNSLAVLYELAKKESRMKVIRLSRNFGSNAAILAGLEHARGDCAGFLAADLQDPPESLVDMIDRWKGGSEVVLAVRRDRRGDPWVARLFASIFNWLFQKLVFSEMSPQGIGFFLIDRRVVNVLVQCKEKNSHIMALILWTGFRRALVEYDRAERQHGTSRWSFGKKIKYFIDAFVSFTYLPLRVASVLGVLLAMAGGVYAIIVLLARIFGNIPIQGFTALMIAVLILSGTQLLILGIIGEYLWRTLDETRHRPPFIVASVTGETPLSNESRPRTESSN
jgi:dolichol-phosphate mannosyltransferase